MIWFIIEGVVHDRPSDPGASMARIMGGGRLAIHRPSDYREAMFREPCEQTGKASSLAEPHESGEGKAEKNRESGAGSLLAASSSSTSGSVLRSRQARRRRPSEKNLSLGRTLSLRLLLPCLPAPIDVLFNRMIPVKRSKMVQDGSFSSATGPIRTRWSNLLGSVPGAFKIQRLTLRALPDS